MKWIETITPKQAVEELGVPYHGWMREMDRAWISEDQKYSVMSRLLRTEWGKVEHVTITAAEGVGFGKERLARLKKGAMDDYRQYIGWVKTDGEDCAKEWLKRCVEQALHEELKVNDIQSGSRPPKQYYSSGVDVADMIRVTGAVSAKMAAERGIKRVPLAVLSQSEVTRRMKII